MSLENEYTVSSKTINNDVRINKILVLSYTGNYMKPEIEYLVVADRVILEKETDKPSIIGIFQGISIPKEVPSVILPLTVFARIKNVNGEVKAKVSIFDTKGDEMQFIEISGKVDKVLQIRAIFNLVNFSEGGKYKIRVKINDIELEAKEEHSLEVQK